MWSVAEANEHEHLISEEWSAEVQHFLNATEEAPVGRASLRLPKAMMNTRAEAYIPQIVSLGPYHHRMLKDVSVGPYHHRLTHLSQMEMYKLTSTRIAAANNAAVINNFYTQIIDLQLISQLENFYDWKMDEQVERDKFGWMMTADAFFLWHFLAPNGTFSDVMPSMASVRCDIVKLENQIPFFLLKVVEKALKQQTTTLENVLQSQMANLCSFLVRDVEIKEPENEHHLLGCMHKYVSSFLKIHTEGEQQSVKTTLWQRIKNCIDDVVAGVFGIFCPHPAKKDGHDFLLKYNAKEMKKAGIEFKSFQESSGKIRFDKQSDTLFFPKIIVTDTYTEVILRNLLALEFNDATRRKHVTQYVELMDCLIDTPEDVTLLRKCGVIERQSMMITDEYVAQMWDGMSKPFFFAGLLELPGGLKSGIREVIIKNYYKSMIKTRWLEFSEEYLSRPWKVVALVVGIFVLVLTMLQTYCSFRDCERKPKTKSRSRKRFTTFG